MKSLGSNWNKREPATLALVLFLCGGILGLLGAKLSISVFSLDAVQWNSQYFAKIQGDTLQYGGFLIFVLLRNYRKFFVFWLLSITVLGLPYLALSVIGLGAELGFFVMVLLNAYGIKGLLLLAASQLPQALFYAPVMLLCLKHGFAISMELHRRNHKFTFNDLELFKSRAKFLFVMIIGILLGGILEVFLGSHLLRSIIKLF